MNVETVFCFIPNADGKTVENATMKWDITEPEFEIHKKMKLENTTDLCHYQPTIGNVRFLFYLIVYVDHSIVSYDYSCWSSSFTGHCCMQTRTCCQDHLTRGDILPPRSSTTHLDYEFNRSRLGHILQDTPLDQLVSIPQTDKHYDKYDPILQRVQGTPMHFWGKIYTESFDWILFNCNGNGSHLSQPADTRQLDKLTDQ